MSHTTCVNRAEVRDEWLSDATTFAMLTGDQEADDVIRFLRDHMILVEPQSDGEICSLEGTDDPLWVGTLPLLSDDVHLGDPWLGYCEGNNAAFFVPQARSVVVRDCVKWTSWWRGILFLHESHHAYTFVRQPYLWTNKKIFAAKERDTHRFQNRIISCFGGTKYEIAVQAEAHRIQGSIHLAKGSDSVYLMNFDTLFGDVSYPDVLDEVFGQSESESEANTRFAHWLVHTRFDAIELACKDHQLEPGLDVKLLGQELQALFMERVYERFR